MAFEVWDNFDGLVSSGDFVNWVFGELLVFFVTDNLVVVGLVGGEFFFDNWAVVFRQVWSSRANNEEQLKRYST